MRVWWFVQKYIRRTLFRMIYLRSTIPIQAFTNLQIFREPRQSLLYSARPLYQNQIRGEDRSVECEWICGFVPLEKHSSLSLYLSGDSNIITYSSVGSTFFSGPRKSVWELVRQQASRGSGWGRAKLSIWAERRVRIRRNLDAWVCATLAFKLS